MMRYQGYYWTVLAPLLRKSITTRYSEQLARMAIDNGKQEYRALLERADDIGEGNPLEKTAYFAYACMAAWLASGKLISPAGMGVVMGDVLKKLRLFLSGVNINTAKGSKYWYQQMKAYEAWWQEHPLPAAWQVHFDETRHRDGSFFYFSHCPIRSFCQREGAGEFVEALDAAERTLFQLQHGKLHREDGTPKTDAKYTYWIVGDKVENPL